MAKYTPIITIEGQQLILDSLAYGTNITLKYFAWGDGNGFSTPPNPNQTSLINEVYRQEITSIAIDPNVATWLDILAVIPGDVGGFFVREVGIFTADNKLFAVAEHPEFFKNLPSEGTSVDFREKFIVEIVNLTEVNITLNPSASLVTIDQLNSHVHIGGGNPSKILLTGGAEVQGLLPGNMVDKAVLSDGSVAMTEDLSMGGFNTTNVANPIFANDGANRSYIDSIPCGRIPNGFLCSNNLVDPLSIVDIGIGSCVDSTGFTTIVSNSIMSKDLGVSWALGNNHGGLPSPLTVQPNTTYHLFVIMKADRTVDFGFDISLVAANLLAVAIGFTYYKRIKSVVTDSSGNIIQETCIQNNDGSIECWFNPSVSDLTNASPPTVLTDLALKGIPTGISVKAFIRVEHINSGTASNVEIKSKQTSTLIDICYVESSASSIYRTDIVPIVTDLSKNIQYRVTAGTTRTVDIKTLYYVDKRV